MEITHSEVRIPMGKACEMLGVHPNTVRRWVKDGHLPAVRTIGGERRFLVSDISAFMKQRAA